MNQRTGTFPLALSAFASLSLGLSLCACAEQDSHQASLTPTNGVPGAVDVAENMTRFVFDTAPRFEDGLPAYGNSFITQGYLYPAGHLDGAPGVLADGSPADPDAVIGAWTCRGFFIGEGAHTTSGPIVLTTQFFDFYDEPGYEATKARGKRSLVTEGYEYMEPGVRASRAITGGTGNNLYARRGEVVQEFLGLNPSEGVNLRIELSADSSGEGGETHPDDSCGPGTSAFAPMAECR